MDIKDILRPKSEDEVFNSALSISDPNELLKIAVTKIKNPKLIKIALEKGADPNSITKSTNLSDVNDVEIYRTILENTNKKIDINSIILKSIKFGLEEEIIDLLDKNLIDPTKKNYMMLVWTIGYKHPMKKLLNKLLNDTNIDPEKEKETIAEAISIAIARGKNDILKILLEDEKIDPSAGSNRPIKTAVFYNNIKAFNMLLKDERVNPSIDNNYLLKIAAEKGHKKIVEILINIPKVRQSLSETELKKYEKMAKIVKESLKSIAESMAEPKTKPRTKPGVKPGTKPGRPSPIRRERPSVTPKPKATAEDVAKKFLDLIK